MEKKDLLDAKEYLRNRLFTYNTYSSVYKIFNTLIGVPTTRGYSKFISHTRRGGEKGIFYLIYNSKTNLEWLEKGGMQSSKVK